MPRISETCSDRVSDRRARVARRCRKCYTRAPVRRAYSSTEARYLSVTASTSIHQGHRLCLSVNTYLDPITKQPPLPPLLRLHIPTTYLSNYLNHLITLSKMAEHNYKFNITMTCGGCSGAVERVLKKLDGKSHHYASPGRSHQPLTHTLSLLLQASRTSTFLSKAKPLPSPPRRTWTTRPFWRRSRRLARPSTRLRRMVLRRRCRGMRMLSSTMGV